LPSTPPPSTSPRFARRPICAGPHLLGAGTRAAYTLVRKHVGFLDRDRRMDGELAELATALRLGALREALSADAAARPGC